jgi:hypothetical protein
MMSERVVMRTLPTFGKRIKEDDTENLVKSIAIVLLVYNVFAAILRAMSGNGSKLDNFICATTPICLIILYVWYSRKTKQDDKNLQAERQEWKNACNSVEVAIVNRRCSRGGVYEDGYYPGEFHTIRSYYHLDLETNAEQRAVNLNQTVVGVEVGQGIYDCLEKHNTVRIYYKPESPMTFLLEEELQS